jgi:hypothetical protein
MDCLLSNPLGIKWPGREADHALPSSVEVTNQWSYTFTSSDIFMKWCLIKHGEQLCFLLQPHKSSGVVPGWYGSQFQVETGYTF